jgi:manganese/iron transport system substrate-binding protein
MIRLRTSPPGPLSTRGEGENREYSKVARRSVLQYARTRKSASLRGLLVVLIVVALIGATSVPPTHAQGKRLHIIASFSILADVVRNVTGDAADVESLIPLGTDPHEFEPSAQDVVKLSQADVVFVAGLNLEGGLLNVLRQASQTYYEMWGCLPIRPLTAATTGNAQPSATATPQPPDQTDSLSTLCSAQYDTVKTAFGLTDIAPAGTVTRTDSGYYAVLAAPDPHVWMDPVNTALWTLMIRDMLIAVDPGNTDLYTQNAAAYVAQLAALDKDIAVQIATIPPEHRVIVTNHAAFNYFAARYGLDVVGVVIPGGSTLAEPSVQDVLKLVQAVQDQHVPAIFTETTVSQNLAQQIADQTGAKLVQLYTGSLSAADGPAATYLDYMRYNAGQIAGALK